MVEMRAAWKQGQRFELRTLEPPTHDHAQARTPVRTGGGQGKIICYRCVRGCFVAKTLVTCRGANKEKEGDCHLPRQRLGTRQPSGAFDRAPAGESARGLAQSNTLRRHRPFIESLHKHKLRITSINRAIGAPSTASARWKGRAISAEAAL